MVTSGLLDIRMHNAESKTKYKPDTSELRQRKSKRKESSKFRRKMVGSGSGEPLGHDLADVRMELLEFDSEDESDELDTKCLISSSLSNNNTSIPKDVSISKDTDGSADDENVWSISIQMFIPFLLAGFGMVAASLLLDVVQVD